jgi:cold shock CspA family protein
MARKERLFIIGENAHLLTPVVADSETLETDVSFSGDGTKFRWRRRTKEKASVEPITPALETLQQEAGRLEDAKRPKFSEDVLETWRNDSEAFRSDPEPITPTEPPPAIQHRSGIISEVNSPKQYFFVEDSETGERYFCHHSETSKPHNHYFCLYTVGQSVLFDAIEGDTRALNVRLAADPVLPETETAIVCHWNAEKQYGFASRNCECQVFISGDRIVTFGAETLKPGSQVRFQFADHGQKHMAVNIEIFQEAPQTVFGQALLTALQGETCQ